MTYKRKEISSYNCKPMPPKISSAEWEVMNVIWENSPATAASIMSGLPKDHGWSPKTVGTFLIRLVDKGVLKATRKGRAFEYRPVVTRDECVTAEGDSFMQRVFQGAAGPLLLHFGERAKLSDPEIRELEQLLKAKRKGRK